MRKFKFRAWEESEGRMYKCIVGNTDNNDNDFICSLIWIEEIQDWIHSDTCEIMQYTGFKDIKGSWGIREIFLPLIFLYCDCFKFSKF